MVRATPPTDASGPRLAAAALGTALVGCAGWLSLHNLSRDQLESWIFWVPIALWLLTMGLLCWWTVSAGQDPAIRARIAASWRMGWSVGAIGLGLGFVGPLVITRGANLGPLLGILVTGPGGFVLGALGAALAGATRDPANRPGH
jgi:peptidoglycan/LPS O-acetylase OafA/YrhL